VPALTTIRRYGSGLDTASSGEESVWIWDTPDTEKDPFNG